MNKFRLCISVFQIAVGLVAIVAYLFIVASDEFITNWISTKWNITLILAIFYVVAGVVGVADSIKNK